MTVIVERSHYIAENGAEFTFLYSEKLREVRVYHGDRVHLDAKLHATIVDVDPEDSLKEMNKFADVWNQANPRQWDWVPS